MLCACGCGQETNLAPYNNRSKGWIKGQSHRFIIRHHATHTIAERFWKKVDKRGPDECWLWTASTVNGYGQFNYNGRPMKASRVAYILTHGSIPADCNACHTCNNPPCCNPAHIYAGTPKQNAQDARRAGTLCGLFPSGALNAKTKLNADDVRSIRQLYAEGRLSYRKLAKMFGVHQTTIWQVLCGRTWKCAR